MIGIGEYEEEIGNKKNNQYRLNTEYNSLVTYYDDLKSGKLLSVVPYDIRVSKNIISCKYVNKLGLRILHIASIKNKIYDTADRN